MDPESDIQDVGADLFAGSNALKKIEIAGSGSSDRYNIVSYDNGVHKMLTDGKGTRVILVPPTYQLETGEDDIFYVPDSFSANGEKVTAIGCSGICQQRFSEGKEVVIPEGITSIGLGAASRAAHYESSHSLHGKIYRRLCVCGMFESGNGGIPRRYRNDCRPLIQRMYFFKIHTASRLGEEYRRLCVCRLRTYLCRNRRKRREHRRRFVRQL